MAENRDVVKSCLDEDVLYVLSSYVALNNFLFGVSDFTPPYKKDLQAYLKRFNKKWDMGCYTYQLHFPVINNKGEQMVITDAKRKPHPVYEKTCLGLAQVLLYWRNRTAHPDADLSDEEAKCALGTMLHFCRCLAETCNYTSMEAISSPSLTQKDKDDLEAKIETTADEIRKAIKDIEKKFELALKYKHFVRDIFKGIHYEKHEWEETISFRKYQIDGKFEYVVLTHVKITETFLGAQNLSYELVRRIEKSEKNKQISDTNKYVLKKMGELCIKFTTDGTNFYDLVEYYNKQNPRYDIEKPHDFINSASGNLPQAPDSITNTKLSSTVRLPPDAEFLTVITEYDSEEFLEPGTLGRVFRLKYPCKEIKHTWRFEKAADRKFWRARVVPILPFYFSAPTKIEEKNLLFNGNVVSYDEFKDQTVDAVFTNQQIDKGDYLPLLPGTGYMRRLDTRTAFDINDLTDKGKENVFKEWLGTVPEVKDYATEAYDASGINPPPTAQ